MKILVVDDIIDITEFLQEMLEPEHDVHIESDPHAALDSCKRSHFNLVITDYNMPSMNGQILADALAEHSPKTKVVFLTGIYDTSSICSVNESVIAILRKPLRWAELNRTLEKVRNAIS
ncbi:MAG: hypothetical protein RL318_2057 [Fibrobacterota bacterium]|jgi:DNA-binding NtrC family response regulator